MSEKTNPKEIQFTPEELVKMRENTISYYKDQAEVLSVQCIVEELKARIKKAQYETLESTLKYMQLNEAIQEESEETDKKD
jgi:hypothetical protein